jgi:LacI family transcriptional regulator
MSRTPTLKSIAQVTGFSVTTVSRALGGFDDVNEDTRLLIVQEAARQGYQPNLQARLLQGQRSQTVGLIISTQGPRFADPFFSEVVAGIGSQAAAAGFDLLLGTHTPQVDELDAYRRLVTGRRVDGLVLMRVRSRDPRIDYLATTRLPFAAFGRTASSADYLHIDVDGVTGQAAMTQHLIDLGHKRIAYIAAPRDLMFSFYRLQGFRQTMQAARLPVDEALIVEGDLTESSGWALAHELLARNPMPTAIMTGNDSMAIGAMKAVHERGMRVGHDVAVGGYDDIPAAALLHPSLTTIHQPIFEIGQRLTQMLLDRIAGRDLASHAILITPELLVRESTDPAQSPNGKRR